MPGGVGGADANADDLGMIAAASDRSDMSDLSDKARLELATAASSAYHIPPQPAQAVVFTGHAYLRGR